MLKIKTIILFLGLVIIAGSACVTPTHASSAESIIFTVVQATGKAGAKDELIVLHNNGTSPVDITNWCLMNRSLVLFACFMPADANEHFVIPALGDISIASLDHSPISSDDINPPSLVYAVTNQSSGSMVGSSDTIRLLNANQEVIDSFSWSETIASGKVWARIKLFESPVTYATTGNVADWQAVARIPLPLSSLLITTDPPTNDGGGEDGDDDNGDSGGEDDGNSGGDDSDNEGGVDGNGETGSSDGEGSEASGNSGQSGEAGGNGTVNPLSKLPIIITEILANPSGADTGNEYIELYNPNDEEVLLDGYQLELGVKTVKKYPLPSGLIVPPLGYLVITNAQVNYTLVNTTGRVQLIANDVEVGLAVDYENPKDDAVWVLIDGLWQYTNNATPGYQNALLADEMGNETGDPAVASTSTAKPCASNQFRNPETGRCKLISSTTSSLTPCKTGQERNPETNRCRAVSASTSTLTPCKENQERNPETNRCRNIIAMSTAGFGVQGVQDKAAASLSWYYWAGIALVVLLVCAYAVWEWRAELAGAFHKIKQRAIKLYPGGYSKQG